MKYLMLIYGNQEKWASIPAGEWPAAIAKQDAFNRKYQATGELIGPARHQPARTPLPGPSGRTADPRRHRLTWPDNESAGAFGNGASVRSRWLNPRGARAWRRPDVWTVMSLGIARRKTAGVPRCQTHEHG